MRDSHILLFVAVLSLFAVIAPAAAQSFPRVESFPAPTDLPSQPGLPDPLVMLDGRRVDSREMWERERRPELKRLFQHYMYGYMPSRPKLDATVVREDRAYFGGKAFKREVDLKIGGGRTIHLLLVLPNQVPAGSGKSRPLRDDFVGHDAEGSRRPDDPTTRRPAPVFVCISFSAPYAVVNDPTIPVPEGWQYPSRPGVVENRATESGRGGVADVWNIERTIDRGYGVALFYNGDVEPDDKNSTEGVRYHILRRAPVAPAGRRSQDTGGTPALRGEQDWGAVAAWAWGAQRVVDYLVKQPDVDRKRIAVVGHSRNGKAALLAGAFDERISLVISHQSGCGGAAPSRGTVGESVKQINTAFPHWFNASFKEFNDRPGLLPFDQHALVALCAPRPVLFSNAERDTWANPAGQLEVLQTAEPVYRLLGEGPRAGTPAPLAPREMPAMGEVTSGRLAYFIRPGEHSMKRVDWDAFLKFADSRWGVRR